MKEPSIISELGYTWVKLPKSELLPLSILEKLDTGFFRNLTNKLLGVPDSLESSYATLKELLPPTGINHKLPKASKREEIPNFKGHDILSAKAGLEVSGFKSMGNAEAKSNIQKARKLLYEFKKPTRSYVKPFLVEEYLNLQKKPETLSPLRESLQEGNLYVVIEVLQTKEFSLQDASDFEISGNVSANLLAEYKASATMDKEVENQMSYQSKKPVTFALKAYKLCYNEDTKRYSLSKTKIKSVRSEGEIKEAEGLKESMIEF